MTPWETVLTHYTFPEKIGNVPFVPEPKQIETINTLADNINSGIWLDMGTGKTFVSTAIALYQRTRGYGRAVVVMPPLLVPQWGRWLKLISPALRVTEYQGAPAKRQGMSLNVDFVLVGVQIFKRDLARFQREFGGTQFVVVIDEATFIANIGTASHDTLFEFSAGMPRMLLTGTPANAPGDTYGLMKFTAPGVYRNKKTFENLHVEERDFYLKPIKWRDLDTLHRNLLTNSCRVLYQDMYGDLETPLYDLIHYNLHDDHQKLYNKLANEELLALEDGGKVDGTTANKLRHALGQIIINYGYFASDPKKSSAALEMIEEKLHALGDGKLVVFAHYRMSVALLVERLAAYGAAGINSEVSAARKDQNVQAFINDPAKRVLVIQYVSGGKGLDGLQHVCHTALCIEPCQQPRDFHQAVARLSRKGQRQRVHVLLPIARRTLQVKAFKNLITNDTLVNQVVRNAVELRHEIFGTTSTGEE